MKPILFITGHVPAYRAGALAALHEREGIELALFGGRSLHGGPAARSPEIPSRDVHPRELFSLVATGGYRAVICPTGGRLAPLAGWAGARRAGLPLILWASLWAHPRSAAHAFTYLPLRRLYQSADAVVTYGPHVSAYVEAAGARNVHVAPQSVDNDFWRVPGSPGALSGWPERARTRFLFVGRPAPEKGLAVLLEAWTQAAAATNGDALAIAGEGADAPGPVPASGSGGGAPGVHRLGALAPEALRDVYSASDVLIVPSIPTARFREPWGLVVNEAMNAGLAVVASDAVGAAAGGLVRDGRNGLVVPAGDRGALAKAIASLGSDPSRRRRLGDTGAEDVLGYSHQAWAEGFSRALSTLDLARDRW